MKDLVNEVLKFDFEGTITKHAFEAVVKEKFNDIQIKPHVDSFVDPYGDIRVIHSTLYYSGEQYVATWQDGIGYIFNPAYKEPRFFAKQR